MRLALRVAVLLTFPFLGCASVSTAQVVAHPNQIRGIVGFTNANPEIVARLQETGGPFLWNVTATSMAPAQNLWHHTGPQGDTRRETTYELTVETTPEGIGYDIAVEQRTWAIAEMYLFARGTAGLVRSEPEPDVDFDVRECAGAVKLRWFGDAGEPMGVTAGRLEAFRATGRQANDVVAPGASEAMLLVRGDGQPFTFRARYTIGSDPYHDTLVYEISVVVSVGCDEVVTIDCEGGRPPECEGIELARITGIADVLGEDEHPILGTGTGSRATVVSATTGPWGNERHDHLDRNPSSGAFELENLMPTVVVPGSRYVLSSRFSFRRGVRYGVLEPPRTGIEVGSGENLDVGDLLVVDPAVVHGDIVVAGAPETSSATSPLSAIWLLVNGSTDPDGDGIPFFASNAPGSTGVSATGTSPVHSGARNATGGLSATSFPFTFDGPSGILAGDYELVVGGLQRQPSDWILGRLKLRMQADVRDDPSSFISSDLTIDDRMQGTTFIEPGARLDRPHRYCASDVIVAYQTTSGAFFNPALEVASGSYSGLDFEGRPADYAVSANARGWPARREDAGPAGVVRTVLPQGSYVLSPGIAFLNPGGGVSSVELMDVELDVGCRQRLVLSPELAIRVDDVPACAGPGWVTVSGGVTSIDPVVSMAYRVNDGPATTFCTSCGMSPAFSVDVDLPDADSRITIVATDAAGRTAEGSVFARRGREPSALDVDPAAPPLLIERDGDGLLVSFESVAGATASVYQGTIGLLPILRYDHANIGACGILGGSVRMAMPAGDVYFLAASSCAWGDGSLGRDSFGSERRRALDRCR